MKLILSRFSSLIVIYLNLLKMKAKTKIVFSIIFLAFAMFLINPTFIKQDKYFEVRSVKKAFADEKKDYVCCSPYDVECVVASNLTVWGTLTEGTSCD